MATTTRVLYDENEKLMINLYKKMKDRKLEAEEPIHEVLPMINSRQALSKPIIKFHNKSKQIVVHVYLTYDNKLSVKALRQYKSIAIEQSIDKMIFICEEHPTHYAMKEMADASIDVEIITKKELKYYLPDSMHLSKHILLSEKQLACIIKKYHLDNQLDRLPVCRKSDALARHYNAKEGDVFLIFRRTGTLDSGWTLRIVKDI